MTITQRMLLTEKAVEVTPNSSIVWGDAEDGQLNGGTRLIAEISNVTGFDATITIWVKATYGSAFIANATTVTVPFSVTPTRIDITGIFGFAARLTASLAGGVPSTLNVSVQVES